MESQSITSQTRRLCWSWASTWFDPFPVLFYITGTTFPGDTCLLVSNQFCPMAEDWRVGVGEKLGCFFGQHPWQGCIFSMLLFQLVSHSPCLCGTSQLQLSRTRSSEGLALPQKPGSRGPGHHPPHPPSPLSLQGMQQLPALANLFCCLINPCLFLNPEDIHQCHQFLVLSSLCLKY